MHALRIARPLLSRPLLSRTMATNQTFYNMNTTAKPGETIKGEILDHAVNLKEARPGDQIEVPYELTVADAFRESWHSAFYCHDRINTSTPFARKLGLQDQVLPFSLMLFLTGSMSHADAAKVQVGFRNAIYHWPGFAGDTFTKKFTVKSVRNTSDGEHSVITFNCELINQRDRVVMSTDKTMLFPFASSNPSTVEAPATVPKESQLEQHLMSKAEVLGELGSHSLRPLRPNQLIIHTMNRALSLSQSQGLSSLARLTHERHFDSLKFDPSTEMFVPGGLVLGLAMSSSARDLHEILHEELLSVNYTNHVHPGDNVMSLTYVKKMDENISGDLESLIVSTIAVKNVSKDDIEGLSLPVELFMDDKITTKKVEELVKDKCPILAGKIVLQAERKIVRQASRAEAFLL